MINLPENNNFEQAELSAKVVAYEDFIAASAISPLTHAEAEQMAKVELAKFLTMLGSLDKGDWDKPTACALWNVRQMVAHLTGTMVGFSSFAALRHMADRKLLKPYREKGMISVDAMNQLQVDERANSTPAELIAELAEAGEVAIRNRAKLPLLLRLIHAKIDLLGWVRIDYLTDLILTRDMWMHRLDICRATGKPMDLDKDHDGRIIALIIRDMAHRQVAKFKKGRVYYELEGVAGGCWFLGAVPDPSAKLRLDATDFALLAAVRITAKELLAQKRVELSGDQTLTGLALANATTPF